MGAVFFKPLGNALADAMIAAGDDHHFTLKHLFLLTKKGSTKLPQFFRTQYPRDGSLPVIPLP